MPCNCTAPLRADIIRRFFANDSRKNEFALELIRIVECQQDTMSYDLREWFRIYFGFNDILLGQFLNCVLKQQTTMSKELEGVIRARYFPASQDMANDFIRVVLCSCCPTLCGTDIEIVGKSDDYTVDGWYLESGASNLVYMESGVITQTVACPSGLANYGHGGGVNDGYESPHYFNSGDATWNPLIESVLKTVTGTEYLVSVYVDINYVFGINYTGVFQTSIDSGVSWVTYASFDNSNPLMDLPMDIGTNDFIHRAVITDTVTGCQFYNPAPPDLGSPVIYFILDDPFLSQFLGWTFNGTDLLDFRDNILPTLPNFMYDASVVESGDSLYVVFSGVSIPNITVVDALSNPVDLDWVVLNSVIPCQTVTFTVVDPSDTYIQYLLIGSYVDPASPSIATFTDPDFISDFEEKLRGSGYGSLATVSISINGNDVTIGLANANVLATGFRWLDSAMNTGDVTLTNC